MSSVAQKSVRAARSLPKAMLYEKRLSGKSSPLAVLLLEREVRVLRCLATWYSTGMCCAFVAVPTLADEAAMSVRNCQRALASLEVRGIIRRLPAQTVRDKSQTSNEYEFPELGRVNLDDPVQMAERKRVFTLQRERKTAKQLKFEEGSGGLGIQPAGVVGDTSMTGYSVGALASVDSAGMLESCCKVTGPVTSWHRPGDTVSPHEHYEELHDDKDEPISSLGDAHEVQKLPVIRRAKTTARTTANAKTGASEEPRVNAEGVRRERLPRPGGARGYRVQDVREGLDGMDAAVWDVVSDVLKDAGIAPERCTRKLREALDAALRLYVDTGCGCLNDAGVMALARLREFRGLGYRLTVRWSLPVFFSDGHWLWPQTWK